MSILFQLSKLSCSSCHVLAIPFSWSSVQAYLSGRPLQTDLCWLSRYGCPAAWQHDSILVHPSFFCPRCPVHAVTFWLLCPYVLSQLSCHECLDVMSLLSFAGCPVPSVYSVWPIRIDFLGQTVKADMSQLSCLDYSAPAVLCWMSCHSYPVPGILSQPFPSCNVLAILFSLSFPGWHDIADLSNLSKLTCPSCPVQAILYQLSCPGCPVQSCPIEVVLYQLSCPIKNKSG